jgi:hypothetical protein
LLRCISSLLARSGGLQCDGSTVAFGAKRTWTVVWLRPLLANAVQRLLTALICKIGGKCNRAISFSE